MLYLCLNEFNMYNQEFQIHTSSHLVKHEARETTILNHFFIYMEVV